MPVLLSKTSILDFALLIILVIFASFLWIDLRYVREDISALRVERDFLALKIQEMRKDREYLEERLGETLIGAGILSESFEPKISEIRVVKVTAYSSTIDQTDNTPFITAAGTRVRDGIVAANFLPFNTKIKLPEAFGEKIFIVEDRMKRNDLVDIWFPTKEGALAFGVRNLKMEILSN